MQTDIWQITEDTAAKDETLSSSGKKKSLFEVVKITGVKPLEHKVGSDDPDVPTALDLVLFGPSPDHKRPLKTYAVIDAGKVFGLQERLATSSLLHRCLYTGESAETYGDFAPWLVELDSANTFTQALFQYNPDKPSPHHMWEVNPGIFVRSFDDLETLVTHFRKFTKLADSEGKWFFFRFWEGVTWDALVTLGGADPEIVARLLGANTVIYRSATTFSDGTFFSVRSNG